MSPRSFFSWGVRVFLTSRTGENAVIMSDRGEVTALFSPLSFHEVRIDIESFPTGIVMPSSGQKFIPTASTVR